MVRAPDKPHFRKRSARESSKLIKHPQGFWSRLLTGDEQITGSQSPQSLIGTEFLPDFCNSTIVLNLIILAQFIAIVITILSQPLSGNAFQDLMLVSIFVHWIALSSMAVLCISRRFLNTLPPERAMLMVYGILLCVTFIVSELALWVMFVFGKLDSPRPDWYGYFHVQNLTVSAILNTMALRYFMARHQLRLKTASEAQVRMEIQKYRIRPHFLFNSMNIIASLTQYAPDRAEAAIEDMADLFRLMLDESKDLVPLQSEVAVAKKYIRLEKLRLDRRLKVRWSVVRFSRSAKTPVLMLQLALESAIYHGIEPIPEGGEIHVNIEVRDDLMYFTISHDVSRERFLEVDVAEGPALQNIRNRLAGHYGDRAEVVTRLADDKFSINICHPASGEIV